MIKKTFTLLVILFCIGCYKKTSFYSTSVVSDIDAILTALRSYNAEYNTYPDVNNTNELKSSKQVVKCLLDSGCLYVNNYEIPLDPWSNEYLIAIDMNDDQKCVIQATNIIDFPLAVWSIGANGVNEYGQGDDIASWNMGSKITSKEEYFITFPMQICP